MKLKGKFLKRLQFPQYVENKLKSFKLEKIDYKPTGTGYITIEIKGKLTKSFLKQLFINLNCSKYAKSYVTIKGNTYTLEKIRKGRGNFKRNIVNLDNDNIILEDI